MEEDKKKKIATGVGITGGLLLLLWCLLRKRPPPPPPGMATLHGKVTDAQIGKAIQGIEGSFDDYVGITQADGYYLIEYITPGEYTITFSDPLGRYQPVNKSILFSEGETKELNIALEPILIPVERSLEGDYSDAGIGYPSTLIRSDMCTAGMGSGRSSDFIALSTHPINRLRFKARPMRASPYQTPDDPSAYPVCGVQVRLYHATPDGKITGEVLRQADIPASTILPGGGTEWPFPEEADIVVDFPEFMLEENTRYAWAFFNIEGGEPSRRLLIKRGISPNYQSRQYYHHYCTADLKWQSSGAPFVFWWENYFFL